jgi:solute carrier family 35 protein C2
MSASAMSGLRWTYTQVQLQGAHGGGFTGGPLEVLEQLTPVASITVGTLSLLVEQPWNLPQSPYFQDLYHSGITFGIMAMGGMIAFLMVWAEFQVISFTSALTLMIAGTFKELVTGEWCNWHALVIRFCVILCHCICALHHYV